MVMISCIFGKLSKRRKKGDVCFSASSISLLSLTFLLGFMANILVLSVAEAKTAIETNLKQTAQVVWQREQLIITLEIKTDDPFSRLDVEDFTHTGFSITPYKQQRVETGQQTLLTQQWLVFPFVAGDYQLELPRIRYRPNSGRIQTLALDDIALKVNKLPLYVPPTMPVGKISLEQAWSDRSIINLNDLHEWQVVVKGVGVAKQTMPPITHKITSTKHLQILPIQSSLQSQQTRRSIINTRTYKIPVKAKQSGLLNLPTIRVQYFDTNDSKLKIAKLTPPLIISLNKWLIGLIILLLVVAMFIVFRVLFKKLRGLLEKQKQRREVSQLLINATSYQDIRQALSLYAHAEGWNKNTSLTAFSENWQTKYGKSETLAEAIALLQSTQFSRIEVNESNNISALLYKALY